MEPNNTRIIRAKDVMYRQILTIDGMATAKEAAAKMRSEKVYSLLVEKRHEDDAWGILVYQDFISGVILPDRDSDEVHVYEIMTKPIITVPSGMDIRYVVRLLHRAGIRRAPVEDCGKLVGVVSLSSLVLDYELV